MNNDITSILDDEPLELDDSALEKAALAVFHDALETGCSLKDALTSVFLAGVESITGKVKRKPRKKALPPCPYDKIVALYHEKLPMLPGVKLMTPERRDAIRKRWVWVLESKKSDDSRRAETAAQALEWFGKYFERASENQFLTGKTQRTGPHANWTADISYLMTSRGIQMVIERTDSEAK
jgi:hypothetical protein